jgi:hypothetical protein
MLKMNLITRKELYWELDRELYGELRRELWDELYWEVYRELCDELYGEVYRPLGFPIRTNFSHSKISRV